LHAAGPANVGNRRQEYRENRSNQQKRLWVAGGENENARQEPDTGKKEKAVAAWDCHGLRSESNL